MKNIVIATNHDDWEGVFVDGEQKTSGHKIEISDLIPYLRDGDFTIARWSIDSDYTADLGCYPDELTEIPEDKIYEKVVW